MIPCLPHVKTSSPAITCRPATTGTGLSRRNSTMQPGASVYFIDAPSSITDNADFPASTLKSDLLAKGKTVLDFSTAPNTVTLK